MSRRQTVPSRWLILDGPADGEVRTTLGRLPRETGVFLIGRIAPAPLRRVRRMAANSQLVVVAEHRGRAARVHDMRELRRALLARTPLIFLSPVYPTSSHPDWKPIARMRGAAMARLAERRLLALGGMDERRFRRVRPLGFIGWAGISAWRRR
ncbi:MAG TPA: thiamine phosphate synthase [Sphingomicrobium sp.]|nr:thiamine phosphate synthase [Sphingomicrobium sp.]